jgi:hypothetical protein
MQKGRVYWLLFLLFTGGLFLVSYTVKNDIILKDEPLQIVPEGFYIDSVADERTLPGALANLAIGGKDNKTTTQQTDLNGGTAFAVNRFINRNLNKDVRQRPVTISIKDFRLTESVLPNGIIDGRIQLSLSFGQTKPYGIQQLVHYRGGLHYTRSVYNNDVIESHLRNAIKSALVYFNDWMHINLNENPRLAKAVSFTFTDYSEKAEGDTIYYSPKRPLTWNDFQSKISPNGPFSASVMPNFGYNLSEEVKNGVIKVRMDIKTFVAKSDCWVGGTRNAYALNHEQRHFDIARITTIAYQKKILSAGLTPDTYEAYVSMQYLDSYRDMNAMQKAYDKETRHGIDEQSQFIWDRKIDALLKE